MLIQRIFSNFVVNNQLIMHKKVSKLTLENIKDYIQKHYPENVMHYKILNLIYPNVIVETKYGICNLLYSNFYKGYIPTIKSSINKVEYLKNAIKEKLPNYEEHYSIVEYINSENVIVNTKFGNCKVPVISLMGGSIPTIMSALNKTDYFLNSLDKEYKNKYDFTNFKYIKNNVKSEIVCYEHGSFMMIPASVLIKNDCPICCYKKVKEYQSLNPSGWNLTNWFKASEKSKQFDSFKVYVIRCWNEAEEFYKIGRTFLKTHKRFNAVKKMPYNYEIIKIYEFKEITKQNAKDCYNLENNFKKQNKQFKYLPEIYFEGMQECFSQINLNNDFKTNSK